MSPLDLAVVAGALAVAALAVSGRGGRRTRWSAAALTALAGAVQLWREGGHAAFAPAYVMLVVCAPRLRTRHAIRARAARLAILALAALAVLPWLMFVRVPELPAPRGPYPVGTEVLRWVDAARPELATAAPGDHRNVVVQAWYPTEPGAHGARAPYLDGLGQLPARVTLLPGLALAHYGGVDTHAVVAAPVAAARPRWPVVVFSPGYGAPRAFYTGLLTDLASRGYVVLAVDHPYEAAVTELRDGTIATPIDRFLAGDPDRARYMARELAVRAADLRFVLDRITDLGDPGTPGALGPRLSGRLDLARVAAIGHSFGGATALRALADDPRLAAAANLDGTLYGALPDEPLTRPVLLLESDHADTRHSPRYLDGNRRLLAHLRGPGYRFEIARANHYSFTDAPYFFAPPARLALELWIGGRRGAEATQQVANDLLTAFLATLDGASAANVEATAARHPGIRGGRVITQAIGVPAARRSRPAAKRFDPGYTWARPGGGSSPLVELGTV